MIQILLITNHASPVREFHISTKQIVSGALLILLAFIVFSWCIASLTNQARDQLLVASQNKDADQNINLRKGSDYELKLYELQARLQEIQINFEKLNMLNQTLVNLNTTPALIKRPNDLNVDSVPVFQIKKSGAPQGGPNKPNQQAEFHGDSFGVRLDLTLQKSFALNYQITKLHKDIASYRLASKSLLMGLPLPLHSTVSSGIGYRNDPFTGQIAWHDGADFPAPYGTLILATASGIVIKSGWSGDYGNMVEVQHINGSISRYAHAQELMVKVGQFVKQSQAIGKVGSTGRSTGPHLHYEVL